MRSSGFGLVITVILVVLVLVGGALMFSSCSRVGYDEVGVVNSWGELTGEVFLPWFKLENSNY